MNIQVEEYKSLIVISIIGEFFVEHIQQVNDVWHEQVAKKPKVIAINCKELNYIDSSAIGALVKFLNSAQEKKITLLFYDLSTTIKQIFDTAGLDSFFTIITRSEFESKYRRDTK
jgi:anti-sigma B factor antagonist